MTSFDSEIIISGRFLTVKCLGILEEIFPSLREYITAIGKLIARVPRTMCTLFP